MPDATPPDAKPSFIKRLLAKKAVIAHVVLVLALFGALIWQILNYYTFSTHHNIISAIKTNHMVIYDLATGETLPDLPTPGRAAEVAATPKPAEPAPAPIAEIPAAEITVILTGIGQDSAYTADVSQLSGFVFSYSPYGAKPLETSLQKSAEGAVMEDLKANEGMKVGKFDIDTKGSDFRNQNAISAALSKVYNPAAIYLSAPADFTSGPAFTALADKLNERHIMLVLTQPANPPRPNIIVANTYIAAGSTPDAVNAALAQAEEAAKTNGHALVVIEPQPNLGALLKTWAAMLPVKKMKLVTSIR